MSRNALFLPPAAAICLLFLGWTALGDTIHLRNGNTLHGKILREGPDGVEVQVEFGTVFLAWSSIRSIRRTRLWSELLTSAEQALARGNEEKALGLLEEALDRPSLAGRARAEILRILQSRFDRLLDEGRIELARGAYRSLREAGAPPAITGRRKSALEQSARRIDDALASVQRFRASGRLDAAVEALEAGFLAYPSRRPRLTRSVALALGALGEKTFRENPAGAAPFFDRVLVYNPREFPKVVPRWTASRLARAERMIEVEKRVGEAIQVLRETLEASPVDRRVLFALGRALKKNGDPEGAFWAYLRTAGENRRFDAALLPAVEEAARKSVEAWTGLPRPGDPSATAPRVFRSRHFLVVHRGPDPFVRALVEAAEFHLQRIWKAVGQAKNLEKAWTQPAKLVIYYDPEAYKKTSPYSEWARAHMYVALRDGEFADYGIRVMNTASLCTGSLLPHEIGHLVFHCLTGRRTAVPLWLHEGFALWCEPCVRKPHMELRVREAVLAGRTLSFETFLMEKTYPDEDLDLFYCQAFSLAGFVEAKGSIQRLIGAASNPPGNSRGLALFFGFKGVEDFEEQWKLWVRDR